MFTIPFKKAFIFGTDFRINIKNAYSPALRKDVTWWVWYLRVQEVKMTLRETSPWRDQHCSLYLHIHGPNTSWKSRSFVVHAQRLKNRELSSLFLPVRSDLNCVFCEHICPHCRAHLAERRPFHTDITKRWLRPRRRILFLFSTESQTSETWI